MFASHEPCNLKEWNVQQGRLLTCGRPGRGHYAAGMFPSKGVPGDILAEWAAGVSVAGVVHIVSLLGQKKSGRSEFQYYPFRSCEESNNKPTFQAWLDRESAGILVVHEFPTIDYRTIRPDRIAAIKTCIKALLAAGQTVVLMDSAGAVRTTQVREALGLTTQRVSLTDACV